MVKKRSNHEGNIGKYTYNGKQLYRASLMVKGKQVMIKL